MIDSKKVSKLKDDNSTNTHRHGKKLKLVRVNEW